MLQKDNKGYDYFIRPNQDCKIPDLNSIFDYTGDDDKYSDDKLIITNYFTGILDPIRINDEIKSL